ncbi:MAG: mannan endo-1,4-beta-mannosidase A and B [Clostridia bacterium]|nr:mannan endo-1,4-beta-mannosidase A and B [Clostridia bacterium]
MMKNCIRIISAALIMLLLFSACSVPHSTEGAVLSNRSADENAVKLYEYIASLSGKKILSGQQESTWMGSDDYEFEYLTEKAEKLPAIRGFDYMNDDFEGVNERAIRWHEKGGIVTVCWHCGSDFSGEWKDAMEDTVTDWDKMLTEGTEEYDAMIAGMDKAATALKELEEKGIPVLWRPFHEFDGTWFWWGKCSPGQFVRMWRIMYERYTDYWKLNNLIWVLGFSDQGTDSSERYVGDEYCDVIGADTYNIELCRELYKKMQSITDAPKPLCLHECGKNPSLVDLNYSPWSYFMTWHTEYLTGNNTDEELYGLYNCEYVLTLDELSI